MRSRLAGLLGLVLGIGALLPASSAEAFCRSTTCEKCVAPATGCVEEGLPLYWPPGCVSWDMQQDASKWASLDIATNLVDAAFQAWSSVTCEGQPPSITFRNRGPVMCGAVEFNSGRDTEGGNANIIVFRDTEWTNAAVSDPASTLALTNVTFSRVSGQIYDADIEVNGSQTPLSTDEMPAANGYDLLSILTHEAGHFLGLAHSTVPCSLDGNDCPTMDALYRRGSAAYRTLEDDDKAGLCAIYPPGQAAASAACTPFGGFGSACGVPVTPEGGCAVAATAGGKPGTLGALLSGLAVLLVIRRRFSRDATSRRGAAARRS
jgi:MYXO-CTERM domain-containing protein